MRFPSLIALALAACAHGVEPPPPPAPLVSTPAVAATAVPSARAAPAPSPHYDLVITGGELFDPASGRRGPADVAISGDRIAAIEDHIDTAHADAVLDAKHLLVTPGLVDLHTHIFAGTDKAHYLSASPLALVPDDFAPSSCTTTVVDAGSSGHRTFEELRETVLARSHTRALAFLNIVGWGMRGRASEQDVGDMDADATARAIEAHRDLVVGVKVAHFTGGGWEPVDRAVAAARRTDTRVMVDFGSHDPPLSLEELLLHRLGPGDMLTHCYADVPGRTPIVDVMGHLRPYVLQAHERGIRFDVGYGGASFVFRQAAPAIEQGLPPDTISTDTHRESRKGSMQDILSVMTKLVAVGMSVDDVIRHATVAPADAIGRPDLGRLAVGEVADVALIGQSPTVGQLWDVKHQHVEGHTSLTCAATVRAGKVLWDPMHRTAMQ
jgi:dihydroorotase